MRLPGGSGRLGFLAPLILMAGLRCERSELGEDDPESQDPGVHNPEFHNAAVPVEFAGCELVRSGPLCVLSGQRALTLWMPAASATESFRSLSSDRGDLPLGEGAPIAGGLRHRVVVPAGVSRLAVPALGWSLLIRDAEPPGPLADALQARAAGDDERARRLLNAALVTLAPELATRARALLARIDLQQGRLASGLVGLQQSSAAAAIAGRLSDAANDQLARAYALTFYGRQFSEARAALDAVAALAPLDATAQARRAYYSGLLAFEGGDLRSALREFRGAERDAERLGLTALLRDAREQIAGVLTAFGRTAEALVIQRELIRTSDGDPAAQGPCARADGWTNLVWALLMAGPAAGAPPGDAAVEADLETALRQTRAALVACGDPFRRRNVLVNEALSAHQRGDLTALARQLQTLAQLREGRSPTLAAWEADLNARLALARGHLHDALSWFSREAQLAAQADLSDAGFRAAAGRAEVFEAWSPPRVGEALASYAAAEGQLDRVLGHVPLGEGRAVFAASHERNVQRLVALLVRQGQVDAAFRAARAARVRPLLAAARGAVLERLAPAARARWELAIQRYREGRAGVEAEARGLWALPADRLAVAASRRLMRARQLEGMLDAAYQSLGLPPASATDAPPLLPAAGELVVMDFSIEGGAVGFTASAAGVAAVELSWGARPMSPEAAASALMAERRHSLDLASRVRVLTHGPFVAVDYHALPWRGQSLGARWPVSYGLDLSVGRRSGDGGDNQGGALIVADPTRDLPSARAEAALVAAALSGAALTTLLKDDASFEQVMGRLPRASLFHYAGHARPSGVDGITSALPLAQGGQLLIGDVLALPSVPPLVVLSACEAGAAAGPAARGGWDLAGAFVAAGAKAVIAPVRPVGDAFAKELTALFYAALTSAAAPSPAVALRDAQAAAQQRFPDQDVNSFRILVP